MKFLCRVYYVGLLVLCICYAAEELTWLTNVLMGSQCYVMICKVLQTPTPFQQSLASLIVTCI